MSVFRRKLFNRGGYAHRGTGITSGLTPVQRFQTGGQATIKPEMLPTWMTFMGNLASGKSYKEGFGGAMDILGQAATATAPVLAEGIAEAKKGKGTKYETREVPVEGNMVQMQESYDGGLTWKDFGEPYSRFKPSDKETKIQYQDVPLANNMIQKQSSTDGGTTWKNVGDPYNRFKPDETSTKRLTRSVPLEDNMIQDQESFDGGKTWNDVGVPRHQWEPKDKETKRLTRSVPLEDNMMQDQESFDGGKTWTDVGTSYTRYKPDKETETKRLTRSVPLDDDMLQDQESYDNGTTWEDVGTEYHQWKPGDKGEWKYNSLTTKEVIKKDGKKYKQTIGVYSRTLKGQEPEWKDQLIFEEQIIPGDPKRSSSGNIVMTSGPNEGKTFGAIEFQDGTVMYYDPLNPDRDTRGFVIPDGTYNFFESTLMGDRATVFGKVNMQDVAENASVLSQTLSTGGSLLKQGLMLNNDLDTFQRNILKYGGDFLGQFGTFGDEMRQGLYNYFGADDKALNQFVFEARTFVAQMITPITGETTGRISEPERELSNEALGLFHGIQDAQTAMVAIEAATAITYLSQHRNMYVLDAPNVNKVWDPTRENALNKDAVNFHLNRFQALGFSAPTAKRLIERMRDMEMLGLAELQNITDKEKAYFTDKSSVSRDLSVIIPPGQ